MSNGELLCVRKRRRRSLEGLSRGGPCSARMRDLYWAGSFERDCFLSCTECSFSVEVSGKEFLSRQLTQSLGDLITHHNEPIPPRSPNILPHPLPFRTPRSQILHTSPPRLPRPSSPCLSPFSHHRVRTSAHSQYFRVPERSSKVHGS